MGYGHRRSEENGYRHLWRHWEVGSYKNQGQRLEKYSGEARPSEDSSAPELVAPTLVRQSTIVVYEETRQEDHNDSLAQCDN
ncbi:hypothetical protein Tco_0681419 [Tanacetum coccineum]|uniref:Uncharacterized protein n=1 Tax=Tanacetum coccineum TaxID=301880 RepID=A0ABQ4XNH9_9ASTR